MDGNVEVLYLEDEFIVVFYHINFPESLPVTLPVGFIVEDKKIIRKISKLVEEYIDSSSTHDKPHNFGLLKPLALRYPSLMRGMLYHLLLLLLNLK